MKANGRDVTTIHYHFYDAEPQIYKCRNVLCVFLQKGEIALAKNFTQNHFFLMRKIRTNSQYNIFIFTSWRPVGGAIKTICDLVNNQEIK